jgi:hypothetical protein
MNTAVWPAPSLARGRAGTARGHGPSAEPVLVLNCGSSSIKFALFDASVTPLPRQPLWAGQVEGIGGKSPRLVQAGRRRPRSFSTRRSPTTPPCGTCVRPLSLRPAAGHLPRWFTASFTVAASTPPPFASITTCSPT